MKKNIFNEKQAEKEPFLNFELKKNQFSIKRIDFSKKKIFKGKRMIFQ